MTITIKKLDEYIERLVAGNAFVEHVTIKVNRSQTGYHLPNNSKVHLNLEFETSANVPQDAEYYENIKESLYYIENRVIQPLYDIFGENYIVKIQFDCDGELIQEGMEIVSHIHFGRDTPLHIMLRKIEGRLSPYVKMAKSVQNVTLKGHNYQLSLINFNIICNVKDITAMLKEPVNTSVKAQWYSKIHLLVEEWNNTKDYKYEYSLPVTSGRLMVDISKQIFTFREEKRVSEK
ncbi:hypothetical protein [Priestia koreensis]|uniref:Uncharacterized protein n=1 Tax=Priestia koreensis TaxID=284581 RepID=A0A0M0KN91_9BACI|nr:hypothetical protein [Priestia koreensis]KOO40336.1 hypothetical protein AMD01_21545 [Priestia koreensis]